jgi:hypothetical protein
MGTKSIREIVENALVAHLAAQTELTGTNVEKGNEVDTMALPTVVVSCESIANPADIAQGLGNYSCTVQIGVFSSADASTAVATHRDRCAAVLGALQDLDAIKAVFTSQGDATCYDVTYQTHDDSKGDRALGMMATYNVMAVLPP